MGTNPPGAPTDAELLLAAEDDAAAFTQLPRRHVRPVYAWFDQRIAWAAADLTAESHHGARSKPRSTSCPIASVTPLTCA